MCTTHASTAFTTKDTELKAPHFTSKGQEVLDVVNDIHQDLPHGVILILNSLSVDSNICLCVSLEKKATEKAVQITKYRNEIQDLVFNYILVVLVEEFFLEGRTISLADGYGICHLQLLPNGLQ